MSLIEEYINIEQLQNTLLNISDDELNEIFEQFENTFEKIKNYNPFEIITLTNGLITYESSIIIDGDDFINNLYSNYLSNDKIIKFTTYFNPFTININQNIKLLKVINYDLIYIKNIAKMRKKCERIYEKKYERMNQHMNLLLNINGITKNNFNYIKSMLFLNNDETILYYKLIILKETMESYLTYKNNEMKIIEIGNKILRNHLKCIELSKKLH